MGLQMNTRLFAALPCIPLQSMPRSVGQPQAAVWVGGQRPWEQPQGCWRGQLCLCAWWQSWKAVIRLLLVFSGCSW